MRKFEKLTETAILPQRATPGSAGYDLYADEQVVIPPHYARKVKTGIAAYMPKDEVFLIHIRSSVAYSRGLMLVNGVGVVDSDFERDIGVLLYNITDTEVMIWKGDKIAQGIFMKYLTVLDDVPVQSERTGGFGSSGK